MILDMARLRGQRRPGDYRSMRQRWDDTKHQPELAGKLCVFLFSRATRSLVELYEDIDGGC